MGKIIDFNQAGKLSLEHCRKVLNRNGNNYTDEEVLKIRDFLYLLAEIDYKNYVNHKAKAHEQNSDTVCKDSIRLAG